MTMDANEVAALRATIRELEDENTELNNELGTAVQMLKLERDGLRAEVDRLQTRPCGNPDAQCDYELGKQDSDVGLAILRARLAAVEALRGKWAKEIGEYPVNGSGEARGAAAAVYLCSEELRAALAEPTLNEPPTTPKFEVQGPPSPPKPPPGRMHG